MHVESVGLLASHVLSSSECTTSSKRYLPVIKEVFTSSSHLCPSQVGNLLVGNIYRGCAFKWQEMIVGIKDDARKRILQGFGPSNFVEFDGEGIFAAHKHFLNVINAKSW